MFKIAGVEALVNLRTKAIEPNTVVLFIVPWEITKVLSGDGVSTFLFIFTFFFSELKIMLLS